MQTLQLARLSSSYVRYESVQERRERTLLFDAGASRVSFQASKGFLSSACIDFGGMPMPLQALCFQLAGLRIS